LTAWQKRTATLIEFFGKILTKGKMVDKDLEKQSGEGRDVTFGWKDISYSVDTKTGTKEILQNVSGYVKPGIPPNMRF